MLSIGEKLDHSTALFVDNCRRSGEALLAGKAFMAKARAIYIDLFICIDAERLKDSPWTHKQSMLSTG